jgi:hypothetical protein
MKNVSDKSCREIQHTFYVHYVLFENFAVYEIMWKKYSRARQDTDDNIALAHCIQDN